MSNFTDKQVQNLEAIARYLKGEEMAKISRETSYDKLYSQFFAEIPVYKYCPLCGVKLLNKTHCPICDATFSISANFNAKAQK